jgi:anti-sigma factor RsiW
MGRKLSHADLRELLGAYALDAVDDDERTRIEEHLRGCPPCAAEVRDHHEVAGLLAGSWEPAPDGVWGRIAAALEEEPPPMGRVVPIEQARRRRWSGPGMRVAAAVAVAAAAVVAGVVGVQVLDDDPRVPGDPLAQAAEAAFADPSARHVEMRSGDGRLSASAVLLPDGTGYLVRHNLPNLSSDLTYQLWAVVGTDEISVGVLGPSPRRAAFLAAGDVAALAITAERAGGVVTPESAPLVLGLLG